MAEDISKLDLYRILNVCQYATEKQIKKAYKKQALKLHPDKNPDNPNAAEQFQLLQKAFEHLKNAQSKDAYDRQLRAKEAAEERKKEMNAKRKKLVDELEARENAAKKKKDAETDYIDLEKMRLEAQRHLEEDQERARKLQELERTKSRDHHHRRYDQATREAFQERLSERLGEAVSSEKVEVVPEEGHKIKIKWKSLKSDSDNGGYNSEVLQRIFSKYGDVLAVIVPNKKGTALIEFSQKHSAVQAIRNECGHTSNPLSVSWLIPQSVPGMESHVTPHVPGMESQNGNRDDPNPAKQQPPGDKFKAKETLVNARDFESVVLMRMRQAAERQRLAEQIAKEDEEGGV